MARLHTEPKIFTIWLFAERVRYSLVRMLLKKKNERKKERKKDEQCAIVIEKYRFVN